MGYIKRRISLRIKVEKSCGLKILERIRIATALPYIKGRLLDIGCGYNNLVKNYKDYKEGKGIGVDVHPWPGVDQVVKNSACLDFPDKSFDTISFLASLNHIHNRDEVLKEAYRLLRPSGVLLITMIPSWIGNFWHYFSDSVWGEGKKGRTLKKGEVGGMAPSEVIKLAKEAGFVLKKRGKFMLGLNNLFVFGKPLSL